MALLRSYYDCCSDFFSGNLPGQSLAFLPAFVAATLVSSLLLIFLYHRQTKIPLKIIIINIFRRIFFLFPTVEHSDVVTCNNSNCIRCKKSREFLDKIIRRWEWHELPPSSERLKDAVEALYHVSDERLSDDEDDEQAKEKCSTKTTENNNTLQKPTMFKMKLTAQPCWNDYEVYQIEKNLLKLNISVIQKEFKSVFDVFQKGDVWGWKLNNIPHGHWCWFPLIDQGVLNESNIMRCPNTATMLNSFPSLMKDCVFGNAGFSVLYPGSYIEPHYGPTNIRLRMHLGLHVPPRCWLKVSKKKYSWSVGETLVFDDSFEHSATYKEEDPNDKTPRVILIIDFWHPDINKQEKDILLDLLQPVEE